MENEKLIKLNLESVNEDLLTQKHIIFVVLNPEKYQDDDSVSQKDLRIIDLDRYSSRSSSNVAQIVMRELVMGKSILLSTAENNNEKTDSSKSVIFIKVDLDKFLELCQTEYFKNAYYEDFIGGSFISVDDIFTAIIASKPLSWIYEHLEIIGNIYDLYKDSYFDKCRCNEKYSNFYNKLTNYYQITLKSNIHHDIDFDEENVDWLFKILVKIMRMANYKCTSSSFSTGNRETELGGFTEYISYFLVSSKLEYAEKLLDEFFESTLSEETVLPKSVDKYKLINNEINFTNNVSVNPVEFSLDDKHRIIKLYNRLFGKNNNFSILLSIILDEFKGDFMCKQENIFEIVSSALGANNLKLDNRKIKVGYFHFLKNNCQSNDIFFKLLKIHATDILNDEKDFIRELADDLNLDIDISPIVKSDNCEIKLQTSWRSSYNDLSTNEIILGVLLNTVLEDNEDGKYENEIVKLIEKSLDYVTDSKGKPEPFTVFLSEILHSANTTISEKAFTEICHLIINRVLSNKTKKELLFGYNKNIDSTKTKGTSDANYSRNYYSLVFGNYCNFKAKQLFGYDECDIANACLKDNDTQLNEYLNSFLYATAIR